MFNEKGKNSKEGKKRKTSKETEDQKRNNHQGVTEVSLLQGGQSLPVQPGVNGQLQSGGLRDQCCCLDRGIISSCPAYCGLHPYNYISCSCKCDHRNKMSFPKTEYLDWNFAVLIDI